MGNTSLQELADFGQSIWLDNINRSLLDKGGLKNLIEKGLRGLTSNPTIFEKAITKSTEYDSKIDELKSLGKTTFEIYDDLTIKDIQDAADILKPVYEQTNGKDGYVSLEINPQLALKTKETIVEGRRLHQKVNRENLMLKVPATDEGFESTEEFLSSGINVNVTLIFSQDQYIKTAQAFLRGVKRLSEKTDDLSKISSVASVFVSRIDTVVDKMLEEKISHEPGENTKKKLQSLKGIAAAANSAVIYAKYCEIFSSDEFGVLKSKGAKIQRVLWGSTGTKNPAYSDIKYVAELIGKNTVNTIPQKTIDAFLDHGVVKEVLISDASQSQKVIDNLAKFGIDIDSVCLQLLQKGLEAFVNSFESLLRSIEEKASRLCRK